MKTCLKLSPLSSGCVSEGSSGYQPVRRLSAAPVTSANAEPLSATASVAKMSIATARTPSTHWSGRLEQNDISTTPPARPALLGTLRPLLAISEGALQPTVAIGRTSCRARLYASLRRVSIALQRRGEPKPPRSPHPRKTPESTALGPAVRSTVTVTVPPAGTEIGKVTHAPLLNAPESTAVCPLTEIISRRALVSQSSA